MNQPATDTPKTSDNSLVDIIDWLKNGYYVVIHNNYKYGRYFHSKCVKNGELSTNLNDIKVIYVNVSHLPGLLDDGEWEWYIKYAGHSECECDLKNQVATLKNVPHKHLFYFPQPKCGGN